MPYKFEYTVEAFTADDTPSFPCLAADVLIVAGGGSGPSTVGGGGGGGGVVFLQDYAITPDTPITIEVGGGGEHPTENGEDSSFDGNVAIGGGYGGSSGGASGGSGGGGGWEASGGAGTEGQGHDGGDGDDGAISTRNAGGGGGGAGAIGGTGVASDPEQGGDGGVGVYYGDVFGEEYGQNGWFGGGGGGSARAGAFTGTGGDGGLGGGKGGDDGDNTGAAFNYMNAFVNSGGGGGGSYRTSHGEEEVNLDGHDGIVLVRYQQTADNQPRIGWHSLVTASNASADEEAEGFPVTNLASGETHQHWEGTSTDPQVVKISLGGADTVNYFGIAGHNLGSGGISIQLQSSDNDADWDDVTIAHVPENDNAFVAEFADVTAQYFRILLTPDAVVPQIAVLNIGRILRCERRLYVGHRPMTLNRDTEVSTGRSESGQFLGRVVRSQTLEGSADFKNLTPSWYRSEFEPFVQAAETRPFFWAWRPSDYPDEVAYAWLTADPEPVNELPNGMMSVAINMQGIR